MLFVYYCCKKQTQIPRTKINNQRKETSIFPPFFILSLTAAVYRQFNCSVEGTRPSPYTTMNAFQ